MATPAIQHPPAMKVGGRRLSVTSRPKAHGIGERKNSASGAQSPNNAGDYPRPAGPEQAHEHHEDDHEEVPKKEKKNHGAVDHERRLQENIHKKMEQNRPTKEMSGGRNLRSARIDQPAGKGFAI
ncbi:hypothetical protein K474DRAFT_1634092 [Panus rudis PR-1116 ss-1]|nr:hypothetical protein K474DRAFT_1634092 [Panus rudis PR-1116 ss-1]